MKAISAILPCVLFAASMIVPANAQVPGILNYQGRVTVGGTNLTTNAALFKFALVNSNGTAAFWKNDGALTTNEPATAVPVAVAQGLYATLLGDTTLTNMAAIPSGVFSNANVNLRVWFSAGGTNAYVRLAPDQRLAASGYALRAATADSATITNIPGNLAVGGQLIVSGGIESTGPIALRGALVTNSNSAGVNLVAGFASNVVTGGVAGATVAGGGGLISGTAYTNRASADFATVSGGLGNVASGAYATIGGGFLNEARSNSATVSGGYLNWASGFASTVSGGWDGTAGGSYSTVGGGLSNVAQTSFASVGGGFSNTASGFATTVGGGYQSFATGDYGTVGGGMSNVAQTNFASVGGGFFNYASGFAATVGGGYDGFASGNYATIPGGMSNTAIQNAFAAGSRSKALNVGSFVWSGADSVDTLSTNNFSFTVRAPGGARFLTGTNLVGAVLVGGATAWAALSDSNAKTDIEPIEPRAILRKVAEMPVTTWHYKHDRQRRYIGPMAQDFHAAFGLGADDKTISTLDSDGIMYAAIKGLVEELRERDKAMAAREAQLESLEIKLRSLREEVRSMLPPPARP
jgi:hypothetical protein